MRRQLLVAVLLFAGNAFGQAPSQPPVPLPLGAPGPHIQRGKAPEQGYVPDGWHAHAGSLLKYTVQIRFGEEPDTLPAGMKFGRVSAVSTDAHGNVYVFKRDDETDPVVVFDSRGTYLRSWGKGCSGGLTVSESTARATCGSDDAGAIRCSSSRAKASSCWRWASRAWPAATRRRSTARPTSRGIQRAISTCRTATATHAW